MEETTNTPETAMQTRTLRIVNGHGQALKLKAFEIRDGKFEQNPERDLYTNSRVNIAYQCSEKTQGSVSYGDYRFVLKGTGQEVGAEGRERVRMEQDRDGQVFKIG